jgi:ribosome-binding protein aMBF1 (putative translation factor)
MEDPFMNQIRSVAEWMAERALGNEELLAAANLDPKVLDAILHGRYTPSPQQRQRLATALGVEPEQISWGHTQQVEHIYGHGPQFGRSP